MDPGASYPPDVLPPGTALGRYEIRRLIGRGGMGSVYEGVHRDLKKRVAIKTLLPALAANPDSKVRFLREGEAASRIRHPHVVDVTDVGSEGSVIYLVMEYLEGEDLGKIIGRQGALTVTETADIMLPVVAAIATAHDMGVIHRDLKPENIFLSRGAMGGILPKVLDFGISKVAGDLRTMALTGTGATFGTTFYLPPEQLRGARQADARSDQYALGTILYECVTGQRAFEGDNLYAVLKDIAESRYRPAATLRPDLPAAVDQIINRAMNLEPVGRFETTRHLGAALMEFASASVRMNWSPFFLAPTPLAATGPMAVGGSASGPLTPPPQFTPPPQMTPPPRSGSDAGSGPVHALSSRDLLAATPAPRTSPATDPPRGLAGGTRMLPPEATPSPDQRRPTGSPRQRIESSTTFSHATGETAADDSLTPRRSRLPIIVGVGAVVAIAAVFLVMRPDQATSNPPTTPTVAPEPRSFRVEVVTEPGSATIELDGQLVGTGAFARKLPVDGAEHEIVAKARGYRSATVRFIDAPPPRDLNLEAVPPPPEPARPVVTTPEPAGNDDRTDTGKPSGKSGKAGGHGHKPHGGSAPTAAPEPTSPPKPTQAKPSGPRPKGDSLLPNNAPIVE